jgi:hypothetical protein
MLFPLVRVISQARLICGGAQTGRRGCIPDDDYSAETRFGSDIRLTNCPWMGFTMVDPKESDSDGN